MHASMEWHGYGKPQGKLTGFAGVGVWVGGFIPQQNLYPHHGCGGKPAIFSLFLSHVSDVTVTISWLM